MNCVIYYRDKWESFWLRCMFVLLLLALCFIFFTLHHFMPLLISGELKIASISKGGEVLFILAIFSLIFSLFFVTTFFGKEKWYFDDNAICVVCSIFGIVFKKRKWGLSNIVDVQYVFISAEKIDLLRSSVYGSFKRPSNDNDSNGGPHYEIYFRLADARKATRVLWSGCPEPAERVYAFIKECQLNKSFEMMEMM